jgi:hypothetical protein
MSTSIGSHRPEEQLIADRIITAGQTLEAVETDGEIAARLAQAGYDAPKLQEGLGLQRAAQTAFDRWQAAARTAHRAPQMLDTTARAAYNARQMGFPTGVGLITVNNPASVDVASVNLDAALADRDGAVQQLEAWMKLFTQAAQDALHDRPDLFKRLKP